MCIYIILHTLHIPENGVAIDDGMLEVDAGRAVLTHDDLKRFVVPACVMYVCMHVCMHV